MPRLPIYSIPLDAPSPPPEPIQPSSETLGMFTWNERRAAPHHFSIKQFELMYAATFVSPYQIGQGFDKENDLRNAHHTMLTSLVNQTTFTLSQEVTIDQLGGAGSRGRWLRSALHARYVTEVVKAKPGYERNTGMKKLDLALYEALAKRAMGILAEFKLLKLPNACKPEALNSVWRECFYQAVWYLAGANYMVGTRLALAIVNSKFQRLHMDNDKTLSVEVHDNVKSQERCKVTTIRELEESSFWCDGPPHDFFNPATGQLVHHALTLYRDTYAQGAKLAAKMLADQHQPNQSGSRWEGQSTATEFNSVSVLYDTDGQVEAADYKANRWKLPSHNARYGKNVTPGPGRPPRRPNGGDGGSGASTSNGRAKKSKGASNHKGTSSTSSAKPTKATKATKSPKKKRRVFNVLFPWRWYRRDNDHDDDHPPASAWVPRVLHLEGYTIKLVSPWEMDQNIQDDLNEKANPVRVAIPQARYPGLRPQLNAEHGRLATPVPFSHSVGRMGVVY